MPKLRLLISEGNEKADRDILALVNGCPPAGAMARILKTIRADIDTEILLTADKGQRPRLALEEYDGIIFTGSNSNIYEMTDGTKRQIDFAAAAFASGTPMFGICWGLQLATVAAGGEVGPSQAAECRSEAPFSFGITLTEAGCAHPMHAGRPAIFDSFGFHSDQITKLAPGSTVTAQNRHFLQGVEIRGRKSVFWGVQYHPELDGPDTAGFIRANIDGLVESGVYPTVAEAEAAANVLDRFAPGVELNDAERALLAPIELMSFDFRPLEILNWLDVIVVPKSKEKVLLQASGAYRGAGSEKGAAANGGAGVEAHSFNPTEK